MGTVRRLQTEGRRREFKCLSERKVKAPLLQHIKTEATNTKTRDRDGREKNLWLLARATVRIPARSS